MKRSSLGVVVCVSALLAFGCSLPEYSATTELPTPTGGDKGTLVLALTLDSLRLQTLVPPISMQIASFDIRGIGPDPLYDHFEYLSNTTGLLTLTHLSAGSWTITVDAKNADGTLIGHGQTDPPVLISAGLVTNAQIIIAPLSDPGVLELNLQWDKKAYKKATAECSLISMSSGTDLAPAFTFTPPGNPDTASCSLAIEAGYYLLNLRLYDNGAQFWGIAEAVRIIAGQTTIQTWTAN
jgi:hypothetical protein